MLEQAQYWVNIIWNFAEPCIFLFVIFIFFRDPVRRWNFFGYRPTAVMGVFDPHLEKVVLVKSNSFWSFSQGGIYQDNVYATAASVLQRELALPHNKFKLIYTKPLGKLKLHNQRLLTRARIGAFSIRNRLCGKGYIGFFIRTNLSGAENILEKGAGIEDLKIVSFDEARQLTGKKCEHEEHQEAKCNMIVYMIGEIENFCRDEKNWKQSLKEKDEAEELKKAQKLEKTE